MRAKCLLCGSLFTWRARKSVNYSVSAILLRTTEKQMSLELTSSPDELRTDFYALETREDIAALLDIDDLRLRYHLYISYV